MHPYPHNYKIRVGATPDGEVRLGGDGLPDLASMPPPEFDGPGGHWSPETLLVAAVADCFTLSFRSIAKASRLEWVELTAEVNGLLERSDGVARFTRFDTHARLVVPAGTDPARARMLMEKAEKICLISNSLSAARHLESEVIEEEP
ncbi:MAG: OsmC family peroxiredoxin [Gammaproteobacteria bacterium]|nr:OsmC family peroxiredoxin [Gammaproteobacteria bacterium]